MPLKQPPDKAVQETAYAALSSVFKKYARVPDHLVIEILPRGIEPPEGELYLEDEVEASIGLPKTLLVAAFLKARNIFTNRYSANSDDEATLAATEIILMFDPEYLTAANYRKVHLLNVCLESLERVNDAVAREIRFLGCILNSPLHRQSKSPTLWFHRLWIMRTFSSWFSTAPSPIRVGLELVSQELNIVLKAAERHQHNYYAFQYVRRLYEMFQEFETHEHFKAATHKALETMETWCKAHPSDTSGWSFLLFLLQRCTKWDQKLGMKTVARSLTYAIEIQWKGEALWKFLRTVENHEGILFKEVPGVGREIRKHLATVTLHES